MLSSILEQKAWKECPRMARGGDEIGVVVNEHSGWLIPLVVCFITACLSALVLAYYFAPPPATLGREFPSPTDSTRRVELAIGAVKFVIPANYLPMASTRSGRAVQSAELDALLPGLRGYNPSLANAFANNEADSLIIHLTLRSAAPLAEADRMRRIYPAQLQDENGADGPFGLKAYAFRADSGYHNQELFYGMTDTGPMALICDKADDSTPSPNCLRNFPLSDGLALSYRFKRAHLKLWREIDKNTRALIDAFEVKG
jgi:hypothetical protein